MNKMINRAVVQDGPIISFAHHGQILWVQVPKYNREIFRIEGGNMKKLEIYIHIPFCVKKCDYCDFLSAPANAQTIERYVKALKNEIEINSEKMKGYLVDTIFIGGGTPSILEESQIKDIMKALSENAKISDEAEITIECNPGTVTREKLLCYKKAGINRISLGLQSADDEELKAIGRIHSYEQFLESFNLARNCGFDNINVDLMSAIPRQTQKSYKETLKKVVSLNPEHISAYSLIVEEGTRMEKRVREAKAQGKEILPTEDEERKMYYLTKEFLENVGYQRYEISNYSKRGKECRHNVGYWKRVEYLGFGIGAASLYKDERYKNSSDINKYMDIFKEKKASDEIYQSVREENTCLNEKDKMEEFMFLGLRMTEGIDTRDFNEQFTVSYDSIYEERTKKMLGQNLLKQEGTQISLTEKGMDLSNYVMSEFMF